eukprot:655016-Hanusia_phi.AAC.2
MDRLAFGPTLRATFGSCGALLLSMKASSWEVSSRLDPRLSFKLSGPNLTRCSVGSRYRHGDNERGTTWRTFEKVLKRPPSNIQATRRTHATGLEKKLGTTGSFPQMTCDRSLCTRNREHTCHDYKRTEERISRAA